MEQYVIYWSDLTEEAQDRLKGLYHENIHDSPIATIDIEDEEDEEEEEIEVHCKYDELEKTHYTYDEIMEKFPDAVFDFSGLENIHEWYYKIDGTFARLWYPSHKIN